MDQCRDRSYCVWKGQQSCIYLSRSCRTSWCWHIRSRWLCYLFRISLKCFRSNDNIPNSICKAFKTNKKLLKRLGFSTISTISSTILPPSKIWSVRWSCWVDWLTTRIYFLQIVCTLIRFYSIGIRSIFRISSTSKAKSFNGELFLRLEGTIEDLFNAVVKSTSHEINFFSSRQRHFTNRTNAKKTTLS